MNSIITYPSFLLFNISHKIYVTFFVVMLHFYQSLLDGTKQDNSDIDRYAQRIIDDAVMMESVVLSIYVILFVFYFYQTYRFVRLAARRLSGA